MTAGGIKNWHADGRVLIVHPDQEANITARLRAAGVDVAQAPRTASEYVQQLGQVVDERWEITQLQTATMDSGLGMIYQQAQGAFLCGFDMVSMLGAVTFIEGLLRHAMYLACRSSDRDEGVTDHSTMERITRLKGLANVTEKAAKLGLLLPEERDAIKTRIAPLRNAALHGNLYQLLVVGLGDGYQFEVTRIDLETGEARVEIIELNEQECLTGPIAHRLAQTLAAMLLRECCDLSVLLEQRLEGLADRFPLAW